MPTKKLAISPDFYFIPQPRKMVLQSGRIKLNDEWTVCLESVDESERFTVDLVAEEAADFLSRKWMVSSGPARKAAKRVVFSSCSPDPTKPALFNEQGYYLTVEPNLIGISAPTRLGRFYGAQTLRQIIRTSVSKIIPCLTITDWPEMKWRGISDDISRGQVSQLADFLYLIKELAYYKINMFQPYIEDTFRYNTEPDIGRARGAITKAEMAAMADTAYAFHIEFCPVMECMGHQERALALPQLRKYAERQDETMMPWSFDLVSKEAMKFIHSLMDEMIEATPHSQFFHAGCDESFDIGEGPSLAKVEKQGEGKVFADCINQIYQNATVKHGRTLMYYGDMILNHPEALKHLPSDAIIVDWHYIPQEDYPSVRKIKEAGFSNIIVSPGIASWSRFYPNHAVGFANVANFVKVGKREGAIGCVTSSWGDNGAENLRENNLLAYAYSAAVTWEEKEESNPARFMKKWVSNYYGIDPQSKTGKLLHQIEMALGFLPDGLNDYTPWHLFHSAVKVTPVDEKLKPVLSDFLKSINRLLDLMPSFNEIELPLNETHLYSLQHTAKRYAYLADKALTLDQIHDVLSVKSSEEPDPLFIMSELIHLQDQLLDIYGEYPRLWLMSNKFEGLDFNLRRMILQIQDYQHLIDRLQSGILPSIKEPAITWLWHPVTKERPKWRELHGRFYFIRPLEIKKTVASAILKGWGLEDFHAWVNGTKVLSCEQTDRVPMANVASWLKKGTNVLAVSEVNNLPARRAWTLELVLKYTDGTEERITGDKLWKSSKVYQPDWFKKLPKASDKNWLPAEIVGKGYELMGTFMIHWPEDVI